jgi:hypothetical protein
MVTHPMENKNIVVKHVRGKAVKIHHRGYTDKRCEEIIKSYQERSSIIGLIMTFGVARNTVAGWLKKSSKSASLERNADRI